ncbi:hypothetical protein B0H19DRAFT_9449 [Mycena capillaripes]|nr:hypothetical protein B0H19DRAFT_9449 [Mycena capillaripes]
MAYSAPTIRRSPWCASNGNGYGAQHACPSADGILTAGYWGPPGSAYGAHRVALHRSTASRACRLGLILSCGTGLPRWTRTDTANELERGLINGDWTPNLDIVKLLMTVFYTDHRCTVSASDCRCCCRGSMRCTSSLRFPARVVGACLSCDAHRVAAPVYRLALPVSLVSVLPHAPSPARLTVVLSLRSVTCAVFRRVQI